MQHNFETIKRKIGMGGKVLPAEIVLCVREILVRLDAVQESLNGLETNITSRQGSDSLSKKKVSKSKVRSEPDE